MFRNSLLLFSPACFQFALVAGFDCDLNSIRSERVRGETERERENEEAEDLRE